MNIYFIRHAEGEHNIYTDNNYNLNIKYPCLTNKGKEQTLVQKSALSKISMDIVIVSPLKRTIQTAISIFDVEKQYILANENIREIVDCPCDLRRNTSIIKNEFPFIDFSEIDSNETYSLKEDPVSYNKRMDNFYNWLKNQKFKNIATVSHGVFLLKFLEKYGEKLGIHDKTYFKNCECRIGKINF